MTGPRPQYAPGDPVLVAAVVECPTDSDGDLVILLAAADESVGATYVRAADVHPVPPTPDPRDQALAAVRATCATSLDPRVLVREPLAYARGWSDAHVQVRRALDGVVPVLAPPAPTPTGWTAEEQAARAEAAARAARETFGHPRWGGAVPLLQSTWDDYGHAIVDAIDAAVLALRAEEAAAAAPATTDDRLDRLDRFGRAWREDWDDLVPELREALHESLARGLAADDAHRAAGSPEVPGGR